MPPPTYLLAFALLQSVVSTQITRPVSVNSAGMLGNGDSTYVSVSATGRFVAFSSSASNLVLGDTNHTADVFVHDRDAGTTERVSLTDFSGQIAFYDSTGPSISGDGRYVAFQCLSPNVADSTVIDTNGTWDLFVRDRLLGTTTCISEVSGHTYNNTSAAVVLAADGRFAAFQSYATDIVPGNPLDVTQVYVRNLATGVTVRVSESPAGEPGNSFSVAPSISAHGRHVAFLSSATNLLPASGSMGNAYLRDLAAGTLELVDVNSAGVAGNGSGGIPSVSAAGRYVVFPSESSDLAADDTNGVQDVFLRDRLAGTTVRVSLGSTGEQADGPSGEPSVSANGLRIVFSSTATNLVQGDLNAARDVFVRNLVLGTTERVSVSTSGVEANDTSGLFGPALSANGCIAVFSSTATNLVPSDTNGARDVFRRNICGVHPPAGAQ